MNQIIYQCGICQKASEFVLHLRKTGRDVSLVIVGNHNNYVYCYEGKLHDISNAVVIINYLEEAFGNPKSLKVFLSTDVGLSTQEIFETYTKQWSIELFFC